MPRLFAPFLAAIAAWLPAIPTFAQTADAPAAPAPRLVIDFPSAMSVLGEPEFNLEPLYIKSPLAPGWIAADGEDIPPALFLVGTQAVYAGGDDKGAALILVVRLSDEETPPLEQAQAYCDAYGRHPDHSGVTVRAYATGPASAECTVGDSAYNGARVTVRHDGTDAYAVVEHWFGNGVAARQSHWIVQSIRLDAAAAAAAAPTATE